MGDKKKLLLKLVLAVVLILIVVYTLKDSISDVAYQLAHTSIWIVIAILLFSIIYHIFEGLVTYTMVRKYNKSFKVIDGIYNAFNCSFYRLSTLGSGPGVAAIVYLGKKGIGYSEAAGLYLIQYIFHRMCIAVFSLVLFAVNWKVMYGNFSHYLPYLILAFFATFLICFALFVVVVWEKSHAVILYLARKINKRGKLDKKIAELELNFKMLKKGPSQLIRDKVTMLKVAVLTLIKLAFWYAIPFLAMFGTGKLTLIDSLAISSLSVMVATVIPTPAGIGSTELIMSGLYAVMLGTGTAAACMLLYRCSTFIFPFIVGAVLIMVRTIYKRFY